MEIVDLANRPALRDACAEWFSSKWGIPARIYAESMAEQSVHGVPKWLIALDETGVIGGLGVIANDFHRRTDLTPNICAVYVEPCARGRGVARALIDRACAELSAAGWENVYLITGHDRFYERLGWTFYGMTEENDGGRIRMYVRQLNEEER